ncbi:aminotransferase class I/II-fold pyridoxal phosphate-dependent enzyme [Candidatus Pelagibacter sp.]|nr:aminotransferase class I/II-fold pyridoxal phosphate-dependent enzyme [Candidatus Pelagibacter sp.]
MKISYGKNVYGADEIKAVNAQLKKTTQMSVSVSKFERKISNYFSKKFALMVNSGSSALMLAIRVLNLKKGDEVILPCLNFGTAVSSLMHYGLTPIFADIDIDTLQINIIDLEKKISKKTKALMIPNLIGNIPDWKKVYYLAKKNNLKIIEDSADTLGASIDKKSTGKYSDISITSFYGSHVISCAGNGGMFLTNNKNLYQRAKILRSWGRMSTLIKDSENINKRLNIKLRGIGYDKKFVFSEAGYNFEPSEIGAAFGLIQLKRFKKFSSLRNKNFYLHKKFFQKYEEYFITPKILKNVKTNFLAYPIIIKINKKFNRKQLQIFLEKKNIQTRPIFSGNILRHPAFDCLISKKNKVNSYPNSDYIMKNGLLIGCHQGLDETKINYIHNAINKFLK